MSNSNLTDEESKQIELWIEKVYSKSDEVDRYADCDWYDLAFGFFLSNFDIDTSHKLVQELIQRNLI